MWMSWFNKHWDEDYIREAKRQILAVVRALAFIPFQMKLSADLNTS